MAGTKLGITALEQEVVLVLVGSLPPGLGMVLEASLNRLFHTEGNPEEGSQDMGGHANTLIQGTAAETEDFWTGD